MAEANKTNFHSGIKRLEAIHEANGGIGELLANMEAFSDGTSMWAVQVPSAGPELMVDAEMDRLGWSWDDESMAWVYMLDFTEFDDEQSAAALKHV